MKITKIFLTLAVAGLFAAGCERDEARLTETADPEDYIYGPHTLEEQGGPFKDEILSLFDRFNTLFLYRYVPADLYAFGPVWYGATYDPVIDYTWQGRFMNDYSDPNGTRGFFDTPADEQYVGAQLELLEETLFDFYTEEFLIKNLPKKVYLLDSLYWSINKSGPPDRNIKQVWRLNDFLAVTWGGERIMSITPEEKTAFKVDVNYDMVNAIGSMPKEFGDLSVYNMWDAIPDNADGLISPVTGPSNDWMDYLRWIMGTPYSEMIEEGPKGFLNPSYDVNGLVRKKYEIIIDYFNGLGIDILKIGNTVY